MRKMATEPTQTTREPMPNEVLAWLERERTRARAEGWAEDVRWLQRRAKLDAGPWMAMSAPDAIQDAAREMENIDVR